MVMPYYRLDSEKAKTLLPGVTIRPVWGERLMVLYLVLEPGAVVPDHTHPHEQMGYLLEGSWEMIIGGERKSLARGDGYLIPSNVNHSVVAGPEGAIALDIFSPPREEYKGEVPVLIPQRAT